MARSALTPAYDAYDRRSPLDDSGIDIGLAKEVAPFFGVEDAEKEIESILSTVGNGWRYQAEKCGLDRHAQNAMETAFSLCEDT